MACAPVVASEGNTTKTIASLNAGAGTFPANACMTVELCWGVIADQGHENDCPVLPIVGQTQLFRGVSGPM